MNVQRVAEALLGIAIVLVFGAFEIFGFALAVSDHALTAPGAYVPLAIGAAVIGAGIYLTVDGIVHSRHP